MPLLDNKLIVPIGLPVGGFQVVGSVAIESAIAATVVQPPGSVLALNTAGDNLYWRTIPVPTVPLVFSQNGNLGSNNRFPYAGVSNGATVGAPIFWDGKLILAAINRSDVDASTIEILINTVQVDTFVSDGTIQTFPLDIAVSVGDLLQVMNGANMVTDCSVTLLFQKNPETIP